MNRFTFSFLSSLSFSLVSIPLASPTFGFDFLPFFRLPFSQVFPILLSLAFQLRSFLVLPPLFLPFWFIFLIFILFPSSSSSPVFWQELSKP